MTVAFIGESCVGKSTPAAVMAREWDVNVFCGRNNLRLAKDEQAAHASVLALVHAIGRAHV